jgi:UDP-N-acetylglucosamine 2-epimerase
VTILVVIGTRPEAIKLAPVIMELRDRAPAVRTHVCISGQHRDLLEPILRVFDVDVDEDLEVLERGQTLAALTSRLFQRIDACLARARPDWILVQGDTTTVLVAAMCSAYRNIRIGHVEAGLRTGDLRQPFPEELNRRITDMVADLHFAPTAAARDNLLREGVPRSRVLVTGNTVVDALLWMAARPYDVSLGPLATLPTRTRWVLMTVHRRENFGAPLRRICQAVSRLCDALGPDIHMIVPVHPNPHVRPALADLVRHTNCTLVQPLGYDDLVNVLKRAALVLTDSGGLQEEAPTFGVPVLVLREKTERPEGIAAGCAQLVGTDPDSIVDSAMRVLKGSLRGPAVNPYGDGKAAERIVEHLLARHDLSEAQN